MRFPTTAALSAAALLASVNADDASSSSTVEASSSASIPPLPTFTPSKIKAPFLEQFTDDWESRWKPSHAKKETTDGEEEWAYVGEWAVEEPIVYKGMEGDKGLVVKNAAAHHAISAKFPKKIDNKGKTLVVQYEVKLQTPLDCGGAYMKLLRDNKALHQEEFSNASPYVLMFGPDKCGSTNKVHVIINHKNPKNGSYEEKHLMLTPSARIVKTTELYTLIIHPNNTIHVKLNGEQVKEANLLEDFNPAFNPPKEIDDPTDNKPEDWVDESRIPDPEATKPEDWDEDAPYEIVDEKATKPDDWLEDEPATIPDPEAKKPEDWDDEEDGDWIAPTVNNPKCDEVSGCGTWKKPNIANPDYKGPWTAPYIDNPAYKGEWKPRQIKNPDWYEDKHPSNLEPMGAVGYEIWTMQNNILFDNIYIGHSIKDAEKFAQETFFEKHSIEELLELADKPKEPEPVNTEEPEQNFFKNPVGFVKSKVNLFLSIAQNDPIQAVKLVPEVAGGFVALLATIVAVAIGVLGAGAAQPAAKKLAEGAKDAKDKVAQAVASGADQAKGELNKRSTRSTS